LFFLLLFFRFSRWLEQLGTTCGAEERRALGVAWALGHTAYRLRFCDIAFATKMSPSQSWVAETMSISISRKNRLMTLLCDTQLMMCVGTDHCTDDSEA